MNRRTPAGRQHRSEAERPAGELFIANRRIVAENILGAVTAVVAPWGADAADRLASCHPLDDARLIEAIISALPDPLFWVPPEGRPNA